ncbi:hypothetical protein BgiMline_004572, partial [Biomphalaria glabrata]
SKMSGRSSQTNPSNISWIRNDLDTEHTGESKILLPKLRLYETAFNLSQFTAQQKTKGQIC